ncbi:MAG: hypothetical protein ABII00_11660 [Elusimicrobiota bacterium]
MNAAKDEAPRPYTTNHQEASLMQKTMLAILVGSLMSCGVVWAQDADDEGPGIAADEEVVEWQEPDEADAPSYEHPWVPMGRAMGHRDGPSAWGGRGAGMGRGMAGRRDGRGGGMRDGSGPGHGQACQRFIGIIRRNAKELGLDDKQKEGLKDLLFDLREKRIQNQADKKIATLGMRRELMKHPPDFKKARAKADEINKASATMMHSGLDAMEKAYALLTSEQKDELKKIKADRPKRDDRKGKKSRGKRGKRRGRK